MVILRDGGLRDGGRANGNRISRDGAMRDGGFKIRDRAARAKEDHAAWILKAIDFVRLNLIVRLNL